MCRISSRYPFPHIRSNLQVPFIQVALRCCYCCCCRCRLLPYVSSHSPLLPSPFSCNHSGPSCRGSLSTRPERGHDPSLGAPIPGHHRAWPYCWSKPSARRAPVTGSQTPNCSLPSLSPHAVQAAQAFALCCKQCLCLQAAPEAPVERALYCTSPARRYNDLSSASHPSAPKSLNISSPVST
ncbi:uncharacterized protein K444DRAFT_122601 [Hyaloscypha bicolor E]|uniref:Uncharacterized protein n=1 Tax=Hyaloscypha bicolor E TaxID=1095630 RepID=A0A2J6TUD5_9HELO|nr:uncharacterized protein K444DRAFT_122601 [Hyaloscypha bicolor E]PMD66625.1 hypothetical protein K444DRAFT_122601 [Hyaloscypha bicolor E]